MTLPASGNPISFSQVDVELGYSATAQISMNDTAVRTLFGVASGAIGMSCGLGKSNTSVPGAPTSVSASATSCSAISVSFSAPACTGGLSIDYYQVVCTGSGTNSATGSSPISVTGLSASTSYTFKVRAHNSKGYGSYSSSTGTATTSVVTGSSSYTSSGTYTFTVPSGVSSVSMVVIGNGAKGCIPFSCTCPCYGQAYTGSGSGGFGGALAYRNNYSVTSGTSGTVAICARNNCINCGGRVAIYSFPGSVINAGSYTQYASGSGYVGVVGQCGGRQGCSAQSLGAPPMGGSGGGGAAGYSGVGGKGGYGAFSTRTAGDPGTSYAGGGGGGGGGGNKTSPNSGGGGGGTGIYGQGSSGSGGCHCSGGGGGSGGSSGSSPSGYNGGGNGGSYGGGAGGPSSYGTSSGRGLQGVGAARFVWPGNTRTFPSTSVGSP